MDKKAKTVLKIIIDPSKGSRALTPQTPNPEQP